MFEAEARWLGQRLLELPPEAFPLLDLASGTEHYRRVLQPFVHDLIFAPLEAAGRDVLHADLQSGQGIDVQVDFVREADRKKLQTLGCRSVLSANMLEHLAVPPATAAGWLLELVPSGGYVVVTVPYGCGYHPAPIDNQYRPTPSELAELFRGHRVVHNACLTGRARGCEYARGSSWPRYLLRSLLPVYQPRVWWGKVHLFWRPITASAVVIRRGTSG